MKTTMSILIPLMMVYMLMFYMGVHERGARTFVGEQKFTTISEAADFQGQVAKEAELVGAEIETLDLTKQSPPTVTFRIITPATKINIFGDSTIPFKYGKQWETQKNAQASNIVALVLMPLMVTGFLYAIWSKGVQNWMDRQQ